MTWIHDFRQARVTWPRVVTLEKKVSVMLLILLTGFVTYSNMFNPAPTKKKPCQRDYGERSSLIILHSRLLNFTGFFSSLGGPEPAIGIVAIVYC